MRILEKVEDHAIIEELARMSGAGNERGIIMALMREESILKK
ncbi:MAG TPA: hypothetical protein PKV33_00595 [Methanothrix sp.]|nr:hypothetical protein [Methanothrix sp.]